eukprot:TRINITY_DN22330_c0_g1_i1.p1 TRINITY_DN22330_c0_g1~~TRINITY_DN22330_c0_g1_i1.p1  ORF type:complete len:1248 (-),score=283.62 TRINITY_DN22330_c0_g1_i1:287-3691(-)
MAASGTAAASSSSGGRVPTGLAAIETLELPAEEDFPWQGATAASGSSQPFSPARAAAAASLPAHDAASLSLPAFTSPTRQPSPLPTRQPPPLSSATAAAGQSLDLPTIDDDLFALIDAGAFNHYDRNLSARDAACSSSLRPVEQTPSGTAAGTSADVWRPAFTADARPAVEEAQLAGHSSLLPASSPGRSAAGSERSRSSAAASPEGTRSQFGGASSSSAAVAVLERTGEESLLTPGKDGGGRHDLGSTLRSPSEALSATLGVPPGTLGGDTASLASSKGLVPADKAELEVAMAAAAGAAEVAAAEVSFASSAASRAASDEGCSDLDVGSILGRWRKRYADFRQMAAGEEPASSSGRGGAAAEGRVAVPARAAVAAVGTAPATANPAADCEAILKKIKQDLGLDMLDVPLGQGPSSSSSSSARVRAAPAAAAVEAAASASSAQAARTTAAAAASMLGRPSSLAMPGGSPADLFGLPVLAGFPAAAAPWGGPLTTTTPCLAVTPPAAAAAALPSSPQPLLLPAAESTMPAAVKAEGEPVAAVAEPAPAAPEPAAPAAPAPVPSTKTEDGDGQSGLLLAKFSALEAEVKKLAECLNASTAAAAGQQAAQAESPVLPAARPVPAVGLAAVGVPCGAGSEADRLRFHLRDCGGDRAALQSSLSMSPLSCSLTSVFGTGAELTASGRGGGGAVVMDAAPALTALPHELGAAAKELAMAAMEPTMPANDDHADFFAAEPLAEPPTEPSPGSQDEAVVDVLAQRVALQIPAANLRARRQAKVDTEVQTTMAGLMVLPWDVNPAVASSAAPAPASEWSAASHRAACSPEPAREPLQRATVSVQTTPPRQQHPESSFPRLAGGGDPAELASAPPAPVRDEPPLAAAASPPPPSESSSLAQALRMFSTPGHMEPSGQGHLPFRSPPGSAGALPRELHLASPMSPLHSGGSSCSSALLPPMPGLGLAPTSGDHYPWPSAGPRALSSPLPGGWPPPPATASSWRQPSAALTPPSPSMAARRPTPPLPCFGQMMPSDVRQPWSTMPALGASSPCLASPAAAAPAFASQLHRAWPAAGCLGHPPPEQQCRGPCGPYPGGFPSSATSGDSTFAPFACGAADGAGADQLMRAYEVYRQQQLALLQPLQRP